MRKRNKLTRKIVWGGERTKGEEEFQEERPLLLLARGANCGRIRNEESTVCREKGAGRGEVGKRNSENAAKVRERGLWQGGDADNQLLGEKAFQKLLEREKGC